MDYDYSCPYCYNEYCQGECDAAETSRDDNSYSSERVSYDRIPVEPPVGTWVRDKHGATHVRNADGWACAPTGFYGGGHWKAMWKARGPLVECGPWGREDLRPLYAPGGLLGPKQ